MLIHQKHLRILATRIFKSLTDINPDFMKSYFTTKKIPYCLRNEHVLAIPSARFMSYGTNSILFRAGLLCNKLPHSVKQSQHSLNLNPKFKR